LISGSDIEVADPTAAANLTIVRLVEDRDVIADKPKLEPPPVPEVQPSTKLVIPVSSGGDYDEIGPRDVPPPFSHQVTVGVTDGGILPVVTVAPTYPRRMAARGIEGWVLLEFSVDQLGRVQNPQVIDAQPTGGFGKAAIDAVLRYKYKPKVFDGKATWVHGVQTRMVFQLDNG
jgi:protein TonB